MPDYVKLHKAPGVKVGLCEIQGRRLSQEDFLAASGGKHIKEFFLLNEAEQTDVLLTTFAELQVKYGQSSDTGSTACVVLAWQNPDANSLEIYTASVGDSAAYLVIVDDAHEGIVSAKRINALHNPDPQINYLEYERVAKISEPSRYRGLGPLRLNGQLAMTRAFGDRVFEKHGLIHIPEIELIQKTLSPTQKAFIVLACDGLTEEKYAINSHGETVTKPVMSIDEIATVINVMRKKREVDKIAEYLVDAAYVNGSHDNISVAVFEIGLPTSAVIFDGHNGLISQDLGENFYTVLKENIKAKIFLNNSPKLIKKIRSKTLDFLREITKVIVDELLSSDALRKIFIKDYRLDDKLSRKALAKTILENHGKALVKFMEKYQESPALKKQGSKALTNLIIQCSFARYVYKIIQGSDSIKAVNKMHVLFKDADVRYHLEKAHSFWDWLFQKLGWTIDPAEIAKHKVI